MQRKLQKIFFSEKTGKGCEKAFILKTQKGKRKPGFLLTSSAVVTPPITTINFANKGEGVRGL